MAENDCECHPTDDANVVIYEELAALAPGPFAALTQADPRLRVPLALGRCSVLYPPRSTLRTSRFRTSLAPFGRKSVKVIFLSPRQLTFRSLRSTQP
jgi:hypothetical protein